MKLHSTLGERAGGFLYTAPLLDVVLLLLIFFLFGSNFVLKSGVAIELPASSSALPAAPQAHIVAIVSGGQERIYFNEHQVTLEELDDRLEEALERSDQVIVLGDRSVHYGTVMEVSRLALKRGYHLSFATQEEDR